MKKYYSKLLLLLLLPINSCLPFDNSDINSKNKNLLIDGKTLREKINLKINKLELEENQEIKFNDYINLNKSDLNEEDLIWLSENNNIVLIDTLSPKLKAIKEGKTFIKVYFKQNPDIFETIEIKVVNKKNLTLSPIPLEKPNLSPTEQNENISDDIITKDSFKFFYDNNKKGYIILEYLGSSKNINIPENFNSYKVIGIAESVFHSNQLRSVIIPDSITNIGVNSFSNNQLTSITIPNSVTNISYGAFANNKLTSVIIPDSIKHIGSSSFWGNKLTSVIIPDSVSFIGYDAFENNELNEVTFLSKNISFLPNCNSNCYSSYIFGENTPKTLKTIKGYKSSGVENFAKNNGINFVSLD